MEYDRVRLKQSAKQAMRFQRPHPMLITLLFIIIVNIGSQIVSNILGAASGSSRVAAIWAEALLEYSDPDYALQYVLLSFSPQQLALALSVGVLITGIITSLWSSLMGTGYAGFCLDMVRGRQPQTGALFSIFPQWADVLLTQFLAGLFRTLWALLLGAGAVVLIAVSALLFANTAPVLMVLLLLLIYIAFFVGLALVTLRYAMVNFLIVDRGLTGMEAIRESKRMMLGNTGRLFLLNLSFIGWYLLEIVVALVVMSGSLGIFYASYANDPMLLMAGSALLIFGLGAMVSIALSIINLWLTPYITGARALFYDCVQGVDSTPPGGYGFGPSGGWGQPHPGPQEPQHFDYTWTPGPTSGTGIGSGPKQGGDGAPPPPPKPKPPRSPKDDPWD